MSNLSLFAAPITNGKALNITCRQPSYETTTYLVVITIGGYVASVLIIQGYTASTAWDALPTGRVINLYEDTNHPTFGMNSIMENGILRTKIDMKIAGDYRAYVTPLGSSAALGKTSYTAYWAIS